MSQLIRDKEEETRRFVYLCRHGHREDWGEGVRRGCIDPGLSKQGILQAQLLARRLVRVPIEAIFCSPFLRTLQTAQIISERVGVFFRIEEGLGEWGNVEWMDRFPRFRKTVEIARRFDKVDLEYCSSISISFPEEFATMSSRVERAFSSLLRQLTGDLLLVTHGIVIQVIMSTVVGIEVNYSDIPFPGSLTKVKISRGQSKMLSIGDTSHLIRLVHIEESRKP